MNIPSNVPHDRIVEFDVNDPPGMENGFHEAWKFLHAPGVPDLVWTPHNGGHWIATRFDLTKHILSDAERFSNRVSVLPKSAGEYASSIPANVDPPMHRPYRMLFNSSFSPKAVKAMERKITAMAVRLIEGMRKKGRCDFKNEFAALMPVEVFMSMMQLPHGERPRLQRAADKMFGLKVTAESTEEGVRELCEFLEPWIDARLGNEGDDMHSRLINGLVDGRPLTKDEAMAVSLNALLGGLDTVAHSMEFIMLFLAREPERRRELRENPQLIPAAVDELFRRFPMATFAREVRYDMSFAGVELKAGDMVMVAPTLANLDDRKHDRPMEVDFHRNDCEILTFSAGFHKCVGQQLALTEMRITIEEWLKRIPEFEVEPGYKVVFKGGNSACTTGLPLVWEVDSTVEEPLETQELA